jgi:hypothetical protein
MRRYVVADIAAIAIGDPVWELCGGVDPTVDVVLVIHLPTHTGDWNKTVLEAKRIETSWCLSHGIPRTNG